MFGSTVNRVLLRSDSRARRLAAFAVVIATGAVAWWLVDARTSLPDFSKYDAGPERKAAFFSYVEPLIDAENTKIRRDRARLKEIAADGDPGWLDNWRLAGLARKYGLDDSEIDETELVARLLRRVDIIPKPLALAQAAKESGWGTSRFARDGNNLFGEWCFEKGCGLVPEFRGKGRTHEVESYFSPRQSVSSYAKNINTHPKYRAFRIERARQRADQTKLSVMALAEKLSQYSERRDRYVEELQQLIRTNDLDAGHDIR